MNVSTALISEYTEFFDSSNWTHSLGSYDLLYFLLISMICDLESFFHIYDCELSEEKIRLRHLSPETSITGKRSSCS